MKPWILALLASSAFAHGVARATSLPDYIRYAENQRSARLEVAIRKFTLPSGQAVDLIGVVHIADAPYYQELNERFATYDSVLFELVGDPRGLTRDPPEAQAQALQQRSSGAVSTIQMAASKHLDLAFQLGSIDYTRKNMVHADASAEEFARMQQERGENVLTMFISAMQAQMGTGAGRTAMRELDTFALIRILLSPDSALEFKKALARSFDQMETMSAAMEGPGGSSILTGRNQLVLAKLAQVLADRKQQRVAIFYGGAHMPGIETSLREDLKATMSGEEWLAAWTMPKKPRADKSPAPGTAKPAS